ncbi:MAG: hypothetical protein HUJ51_00890 [Eggerthellaceae bacterium]|nr:hypothetical protein [Eggerthellaceae bacterium]
MSNVVPVLGDWDVNGAGEEHAVTSVSVKDLDGALDLSVGLGEDFKIFIAH